MTPARAAMVTGASRGIGAATATALARRHYNVVITYRNKAARAEAVARDIEKLHQRCLPIAADLTNPQDLCDVSRKVRGWTEQLDILVLNASGGLERDLVGSDSSYPWRINRDAQIATLQAILPLFTSGGTVVFVTSHWAHLYGRVVQIPAYEPVARSKRAGEDALRDRQEYLTAHGIRLLVVTGGPGRGDHHPKVAGADRAGHDGEAAISAWGPAIHR